MMYTVRKIRNLSKLRDAYGSIQENLMTLTIGLLKQGLVIIDRLLKSLQKEENFFEDKFFGVFKKGKDYERLQYYLNEDIKVYLEFW